jgi:hypothetical protein
MTSQAPKKTIKGKYQKRGVITNSPEIKKQDRSPVISHRDMLLTKVNGVMSVGVAALVLTKPTNLREWSAPYHGGHPAERARR